MFLRASTGVSEKLNDILERSVCGRVVRMMCVCYTQVQNWRELGDFHS
jgi:hypothetical protein